MQSLGEDGPGAKGDDDPNTHDIQASPPIENPLPQQQTSAPYLVRHSSAHTSITEHSTRSTEHAQHTTGERPPERGPEGSAGDSFAPPRCFCLSSRWSFSYVLPVSLQAFCSDSRCWYVRVACLGVLVCLAIGGYRLPSGRSRFTLI